MSLADAQRIVAIETNLAELLARVDALESRQAAETPPGATGGREGFPHAQRPSHAPADDAAMAGVVDLGRHGGDRRSIAVRNQIRNTKPRSSDTAAYVIARLNRDRPDLAEKVRVGELSANAAAIEAGFRRRMITVPADRNVASAYNRAASSND